MGLGDLREQVDFVLAFAVVHEMPAAAQFFQQAADCLKTGGRMLLAEPRGHVKEAAFQAELHAASEAGLWVAERPRISKSHAALLTKAARAGGAAPAAMP